MKNIAQPSMSAFFDEVPGPPVDAEEEEIAPPAIAPVQSVARAATLPPVLHLTRPLALVEAIAEPQEEEQKEVEALISGGAGRISADELEIRQLRQEVERLKRDLSRSKQDALYWKSIADYERAAGLTDNLTTYRLALQFYANQGYYVCDPEGACVIAGDEGERARTALMAVETTIRQDRARQAG